MPNVVATRVRYSGPRRSRNLEERLMVRFPGAWRVLAALGLRLSSPRWRLRRAVLSRQLISGWDAAFRRDFELLLVRYAPDVEVEFAPEFEALGLGGPFRGHEGKLVWLQAFVDAFERWEMVPVMVVDLGDRLVMLGSLRVFGTASGVEFQRDVAHLVTLRGALAVHERFFFGWDKGCEPPGSTRTASPSLSAHRRANQ